MDEKILKKKMNERITKLETLIPSIEKELTNEIEDVRGIFAEHLYHMVLDNKITEQGVYKLSFVVRENVLMDTKVIFLTIHLSISPNKTMPIAIPLSLLFDEGEEFDLNKIYYKLSNKEGQLKLNDIIDATYLLKKRKIEAQIKKMNEEKERIAKQEKEAAEKKSEISEDSKKEIFTIID